MQRDASELLGSQQIAGISLHFMRPNRPDAVRDAETPRFGGRFVSFAVTDTEIALVDEIARPTVQLDRVVARRPRSEIKSADVGKGPNPPLTITFTDRGIWQFELPQPGFLVLVPKLNRVRLGKRIAELLNGSIAEV